MDSPLREPSDSPSLDLLASDRERSSSLNLGVALEEADETEQISNPQTIKSQDGATLNAPANESSLAPRESCGPCAAIGLWQPQSLSCRPPHPGAVVKRRVRPAAWRFRPPREARSRESLPARIGDRVRGDPQVAAVDDHSSADRRTDHPDPGEVGRPHPPERPSPVD